MPAVCVTGVFSCPGFISLGLMFTSGIAGSQGKCMFKLFPLEVVKLFTKGERDRLHLPWCLRDPVVNLATLDTIGLFNVSSSVLASTDILPIRCTATPFGGCGFHFRTTHGAEHLFMCSFATVSSLLVGLLVLLPGLEHLTSPVFLLYSPTHSTSATRHVGFVPTPSSSLTPAGCPTI